MTTRKTVIQTAGLTEVFQNWIKVAAALNSAGTEIAIVYQKFHPVAAPRAGSMKAVAWRTNPPVTGMKAVISPVVYETPAVMNPMKIYAKSAPTGPALAIVFPELRKRPVPWKSISQLSMYQEDQEAFKTYDHSSDGDHVDVPRAHVALELLLFIRPLLQVMDRRVLGNEARILHEGLLTGVAHRGRRSD
tara:strand:+ start:1586 stop:2155 length:570 start_codon:yes stop_codon:yes gene_type:complete